MTGTAFNFSVRLIETAKPASAVIQTVGPALPNGFSECVGLDATMQIEEYREGGRNDAVLKFPGHISHSTIKLRRGIDRTAELWRWHEGFMRGAGKRRDGIVELLDDSGSVVRTWRFKRGLPVRWAGPTLIAGQSTVAVEELEISHEGLFVTTGGAVAELAGAIASIVGG